MTRILVADDEPINLLIIAECLSDEGYEIDQANDGEEAWAMMAKQHYDLLILDRMMPRLDGLTLLRRLKAEAAWKNTPVIMQTAAASQNAVREGLEAGAYYYLTKPYEPEALRILVATVAQDIAEREQVRQASLGLHATLNLLNSGEFFLRTLADAHQLASSLSSLCESPEGISLGLAELLVNAIEHGNLGISYAEKSALRQNGEWENEVEKRLLCEPYAVRQAVVGLRRVDREIEFTIRDQGAGFNWAPFLDFDPARAFDLNGRGIAMAKRIAFTALEYQGCGNVVVARGLARV
jgi:CheY-like chemotaxis protein